MQRRTRFASTAPLQLRWSSIAKDVNPDTSTTQFALTLTAKDLHLITAQADQVAALMPQASVNLQTMNERLTGDDSNEPPNGSAETGRGYGVAAIGALVAGLVVGLIGERLDEGMRVAIMTSRATGSVNCPLGSIERSRCRPR